MKEESDTSLSFSIINLGEKELKQIDHIISKTIKKYLLVIKITELK
jgi:hypothetical protein